MKIPMHTVILTEIRKLRRYSILRAGLIVVVLSDLFAFAPVFANDGVRKNYTLVMNNILESNCTCFFPALILLTGGFLARREYTDDTLKNILAVPVPLRKLLSGKMIVLFFLTVFFGILSGLLGTFLCFAAGLPDLTLPLAAEWMGRIVLGNAFLFIALLPLTIVSAFFVNAVYACTAAGFVYGFFATMEWAPLNYYPVKAVLILFDPQCGAGYDFVRYSKEGACFSLLAVFLISVILFLVLRPAGMADRMKTSKRAARPKGWSPKDSCRMTAGKRPSAALRAHQCKRPAAVTIHRCGSSCRSWSY